MTTFLVSSPDLGGVYIPFVGTRSTLCRSRTPAIRNKSPCSLRLKKGYFSLIGLLLWGVKLVFLQKDASS